MMRRTGRSGQFDWACEPPPAKAAAAARAAAARRVILGIVASFARARARTDARRFSVCAHGRTRPPGRQAQGIVGCVLRHPRAASCATDRETPPDPRLYPYDKKRRSPVLRDLGQCCVAALTLDGPRHDEL